MHWHPKVHCVCPPSAREHVPWSSAAGQVVTVTTWPGGRRLPRPRPGNEQRNAASAGGAERAARGRGLPGGGRGPAVGPGRPAAGGLSHATRRVCGRPGAVGGVPARRRGIRRVCPGGTPPRLFTARLATLLALELLPGDVRPARSGRALQAGRRGRGPPASGSPQGDLANNRHQEHRRALSLICRTSRDPAANCPSGQATAVPPV